MTAWMQSPLMNGRSDSVLDDVSAGACRASRETSSGATPNPEAAPIAKRRQFSAAEKQGILSEANRCTEPGQIGALLRREGIYASMLATWRKQRARGAQAGLPPRKRGPNPNPALAGARELKILEEQNARLRHEFERAHTIINVQNKTVHRAWSADRAGCGRRAMTEAFHQLEPRVGTAAAYAVLSINRVQIYRERPRALQQRPPAKARRPRPPLTLSEGERQQLL